MDTEVLLYEINHPYVYDNPVCDEYYIYCAAPRVRNYVVRDPEIVDNSSSSDESDEAPASKHHHLPNDFL